jgi:dTDP-4-amino-4,6-dideoxygalactose transaminase
MTADNSSKPIPFVDLRVQYDALKHEIDTAIQGVLDRGDFILGSAVANFETAFAAFNGSKHCIGVGTGLDALRLALAAFGIGQGDEVILPANTFIASALAVSAVGALPVLVDCEADSFNIDPTLIEAAITPRTRAIMPVHLCGQSADMDPILEIAARHGLVVVEDAAQAHGAHYKGRACGAMGDAGCFSFYPSKNLGAYGDAGAVLTNDPARMERLRQLRHYGQRTKYDHVVRGYNSCLDSIQAAVLGIKLPRLREWNEARARHAARYREALAGVGDLVLPRARNDASHIYHLFIVQTEARDALKDHLAAAGIQTNIHYPIPIHLQEAYQDLGYCDGTFPVSERLAKRILSLPMFPEMTAGQIARVTDAIRGFYGAR